MMPALFVAVFVYFKVYYSENWFMSSQMTNFVVAVIAVFFPVFLVRFSPKFKKLKEIKVLPVVKYTFLFCVILFDIVAFSYAFLIYESGRTDVFASFDFLKEKGRLIESIDNNFKIYENKYRGFVMKYPNNWSYTNGEKNKIVEFLAPLSSTSDDFRENLLLNLTKSAINLEQLEKEVNNAIEKASIV